MFERPDTVAKVASIGLHLSNKPVTRPGHVISLEGDGLLVVPLPGDPSPAAGDLPEPSITLGLDGTVRTARYLSPLRSRAVEDPLKEGAQETAGK
jgi:hypothetical protein